MDTTQETANDRTKIYVNGQQITGFDTITNNSQNTDGRFNINAEHGIGRSSTAFDGYMADIYFVDGQALTPTSFAETDSTYGHWKPKAWSGTYGTNGFHLQFEDSSSIGNDTSGNNNDWTPANLSAYDVMAGGSFDVGSGGNTFATMNPLYRNQTRTNIATYKEGNLKVGWNTDAMCESTIGVYEGKWYYEVVSDASAGNHDCMHGIGASPVWGGDCPGCNSYGISMHANGNWTGETGGDTSGATMGNGDIIGIAFDLDNNKIWQSKNGTWTGTPASNTNGASFGDDVKSLNNVVAASRVSNAGTQWSTYNFGQDSSFAGTKTAQGNQDSNGIGDFYYTPPSGFLAMCTKNLPTPTIADPQLHHNTHLYSGNDASSQAVTGVGFAPDFVWISPRLHS
ncbi:MAG: hypothetical protein QF535_21410, partial [Anaerolineales bacterium]|nr:hypothetical protein [Anaerolineales bacterium]